MNTFGDFSAAAIAHYAAADAQAARLAALGQALPEPGDAPASPWDDDLLERLIQPLGRPRD